MIRRRCLHASTSAWPPSIFTPWRAAACTSAQRTIRPHQWCSLRVTLRSTIFTIHLPARFDAVHSVADVQPLVWGYKYTREIARRMPHFRGEAAPLHPKFPTGSAAAVVEEGMPYPIDAAPIVYTAEDDKAIEQYIRLLGTFNAVLPALRIC